MYSPDFALDANSSDQDASASAHPHMRAAKIFLLFHRFFSFSERVFPILTKFSVTAELLCAYAICTNSAGYILILHDIYEKNGKV